MMEANMEKQEKLNNILSNIDSLKRQIDNVLIPEMKLMLELQLGQLEKLAFNLQEEINNEQG